MSVFVDDNLPDEQQNETFMCLRAEFGDYKPPTKDEAASYRILLTAMENTNDLFADYQPHNTSVFSVLDDMGIATTDWVGTAASSATSLSVSTPTLARTHSRGPVLMRSLDLILLKGTRRADFLSATPDSANANRIICHGVLNGVKYIGRTDPRVPIPSVDLQNQVRTAHPVALGNGAVDALLAYFRVANQETANVDDMVTLLAALESLILGDDDVTSQLKAEDSRTANDFQHFPGGFVWHLANDDASMP
ncbi:hypothetical protein N657DRAFT_683179 [Parathielavia appendiculata]|uniref:Uncharacterized protein n=1 Tax=Parathielavia appendiculata TaxID=2587402 RepID=A0AAN6TUN1_9PEZI|nr:hypothetical protein N657DRAFT_683179 [Parathielavia appendiculata]